MKILLNTGVLEPVGGVEVVTLEGATELAKRGHSLHVAYGADGRLRSEYECLDAVFTEVSDFSFSPRKAPRDLARFVKAAGRCARNGRPDVIWLTRFEHIVWAQVVSRLTFAPIVCHLHHVPMYNRAGLFARGVSQFLAVSEFIRDAYIARGLEAARISVVPNAVDVEKYRPGGLQDRLAARNRLGLAAESFVVLYMGRIERAKGVDVLLKAWRLLGLLQDRAQLVLLGDALGDDAQAFLRSVRSSGELSQSCVWLPFQQDVLPMLHAADAVIMPSVCEEAFGRVIIETMATGRPVIATRVGGIPEVLNGPMERFLVEPGDAGGLANAIESLRTWRIDDPGLGDRCRQWVEQRFAFDHQINALEYALLAAAGRVG